MFKTRLRLKIGLSLCLAISSLLNTGGAWAAEVGGGVDPYNEEGNLSVLRCVNKGGLDFGLFLDTVIYNDTFYEGVVEPWNDILQRNQCQSNDVISLVGMQDNLRKAIRDAFLTCNTDKLPRLKSRFYRITAEIYYVRHIVDGGLVVSLPLNLLDLYFTDAVVKSDGEMYQEMKKRYVKPDILSQDDFDNLYRTLRLNYKDKIPSYVNECKKGSWQAVATKWEEFRNDWGGLKSAGEELGKGVSSRGRAFVKEAENMEIAKFLTNETTFGSYVGSFFQVGVNGLTPEEGLKALSEALIENLPGGSLPTQESLLSKLSGASAAYDFAETQQELRSKFTILYSDVNDAKIAEIIEALDGRSNTAVEGAIESIEKSFPQMAEILGCVDSMNDRQCPGL